MDIFRSDEFERKGKAMSDDVAKLIEKLQKNNNQLREALQKIADSQENWRCTKIARAALKEGE